MFEYLVRAPFRSNGRVMTRGEVLPLTSRMAASATRHGVLVEKASSGLLDILATVEARVNVLTEKLGLTPEEALARSLNLTASLLLRHESLKSFSPPSAGFMEEVEAFNRAAKGKNPVTRIQADTGAGEWAGYNCNIGSGCPHGCRYCYAEKIASRFNRIANSHSWREERLNEVTTARCKKYSEPIMFATTHDITPGYLAAYRCHLYNLLAAGNEIVIVSKPHRASIEAICSEFTAYRDTITFRFTIGGLDNEAMRVWEPYAPPLAERLWCLKHAFERGYRTSVSAEPMLVDGPGAEKLYYTIEPLVTEDIWFGKMKYLGSFRNSDDTDLARRATELYEAGSDGSITELVQRLGHLRKVRWKDSINNVINKITQHEDKI